MMYMCQCSGLCPSQPFRSTFASVVAHDCAGPIASLLQGDCNLCIVQPGGYAYEADLVYNCFSTVPPHRLHIHCVEPLLHHNKDIARAAHSFTRWCNERGYAPPKHYTSLRSIQKQIYGCQILVAVDPDRRCIPQLEDPSWRSYVMQRIQPLLQPGAYFALLFYADDQDKRYRHMVRGRYHKDSAGTTYLSIVHSYGTHSCTENTTQYVIHNERNIARGWTRHDGHDFLYDGARKTLSDEEASLLHHLTHQPLAECTNCLTSATRHAKIPYNTRSA